MFYPSIRHASAAATLILAALITLPGVVRGDTYHMLLERDVDLSGQTDLYLISYPSLADFIANTNLTQEAADVELNPGFSVGGFTEANGSYHMLLERDVDLSGQTDLFLISYPSLADFIANTNFTQETADVDLNPGFSVGGFTEANGSYHMLLERDVDLSGQTDLFLISYPSLADFIANTNFTQETADVDLNPGFSVGGLAVTPSSPPPPAIPEPTAGSMLLLAATIQALRRSRPASRCR